MSRNGPWQLPGEAWRVARESGFASLWFHFLQWASVYRRMIVTGGPLPRREEEAEIPLEFGVLGEDQLEDHVVLRPDMDLSDVRRRFASGHWCYTARTRQRELIGTCWIAAESARIDYADCGIELAARTVYIYDQFVSAGHRGLRVAGALETHRDQDLRRRGYKLCVAAYWSENRIPLGRSRKRAHSEIGMLHCYGLLGWRWRRLTLEPSDHPPLLRLVDS